MYGRLLFCREQIIRFEMKKIVLIGDIIASKRINNRAAVQRKLNRLFDGLNADNRSLESPFTITLGDEFQSLYKNADNVLGDIWKILFTLYPEKARFSIGVGNISTKINRQQAIGMDGPAFYNARQGLEELKNNLYLFNVTGDGINNSDLIRQTLFFVSHAFEKWKLTRMKIFDFLMDGRTIKEISKKIRITDKAVYKNIDTGGMYIIMEIFNEISASLNSAIKGT